jgi:hypothetical protein
MIVRQAFYALEVAGIVEKTEGATGRSRSSWPRCAVRVNRLGLHHERSDRLAAWRGPSGAAVSRF